MSKKYSGSNRETNSQLTKPKSTISDSQESGLQLERLVNKMLVSDTVVSKLPSFGISKEAQEGAKQIIEKGIRSFADHSQQLADEIADFDKKREDIRREIKRGARRTSGRII